MGPTPYTNTSKSVYHYTHRIPLPSTLSQCETSFLIASNSKVNQSYLHIAKKTNRQINHLPVNLIQFQTLGHHSGQSQHQQPLPSVMCLLLYSTLAGSGFIPWASLVSPAVWFVSDSLRSPTNSCSLFQQV